MRTVPDQPRERFRLVMVAALAWALIAGVMLVWRAPRFPQSRLEWFLVLVVGPPFYVLGEGFFGWLFSAERGRQISSRPFSLLRVLLALLVVLALAGLGVLVSALLGLP